MAELVDALDSKSSILGCAGSIPARGTYYKSLSKFAKAFFYAFQTKIMFHIYALKSISRNYIYVGFTSDLERRIGEHNNGYNKTTKPYAPFKLIYSESVDTRNEARIREKYWKSGTGKRKLKKLIQPD